MSFLNKFQYHYHEKQLEILSTSNKHEEILSYLEKLSDKNKIFHDLSLKYADNAINKSTQDVSKKQIVWINSFLDKDKKYLETFLENYLSNFNSLKQSIKSYQEEIDDILINQEKIDFNQCILLFGCKIKRRFWNMTMYVHYKCKHWSKDSRYYLEESRG